MITVEKTSVTMANHMDLEREATEIGRSQGSAHANYVNAYGGNLHAVPKVPGRFTAVQNFYLSGYEEGIGDYQDAD